MKYTDEQRIKKICSITEKLLTYLNNEAITAEDVLSKETIRWTITTPLYKHWFARPCNLARILCDGTDALR